MAKSSSPKKFKRVCMVICTSRTRMCTERKSNSESTVGCDKWPYAKTSWSWKGLPWRHYVFTGLPHISQITNILSIYFLLKLSSFLGSDIHPKGARSLPTKKAWNLPYQLRGFVRSLLHRLQRKKVQMHQNLWGLNSYKIGIQYTNHKLVPRNFRRKNITCQQHLYSQSLPVSAYVACGAYSAASSTLSWISHCTLSLCWPVKLCLRGCENVALRFSSMYKYKCVRQSVSACSSRSGREPAPSRVEVWKRQSGPKAIRICNIANREAAIHTRTLLTCSWGGYGQTSSA